MTIPALPSLDRTSPTFRTELDTFFLTQLPGTVTALNAELTRIDGITAVGFTATSTTSLTIAASGSVTLTVQTGKGFAAGQLVLLAVTANPATQMQGIVSSYNATTGELVLAVNTSAGSGTHEAWTVSLTTAAVSPYGVGDVVLTNRPLSAPAWLPADGSIYSQSSYAELYAEIGLLRNGTYAAISMSAYNALPYGVTMYGADEQQRFPFFVHDNKFFCYTKGSATTHRLSVSTDAFTWTNYSLPSTAADSSYLGIVAIGTTLVALPPSNNAWVARSTDGGVTWATHGLSGATTLDRIFVINNTFVVLSGGVNFWTSLDGIAWTARTASAPFYLLGIAGGTAYAYSTAAPWAIIHTSTDGITWVARAQPNISYSVVKHNPVNNVTLLVPSSGSPTSYRRSTDNGVTWTTITNDMPYYPGGGLFPSIAVYKGRFYTGIVTTPGGVQTYSSVDGITWEALPLPDNISNTAPDFRVIGGELWQFSSSTGVAWFTSDGANWQKAPTIQSYSDGQRLAHALEANGWLAWPTGTGGRQVIRRPVYTYNTATQFVVPKLPAPAGVTAYIKA